jgi:hypothetical protein
LNLLKDENNNLINYEKLFIDLEKFKDEIFYNDLNKKDEDFIRLRKEIINLNDNQRRNKEIY